LGEDDPAARLAALDLAQRGGELLDRIDLGRQPFEPALFVERKNFGKASRHLLRHALAIVADLQTADLNVFDEQIVGLDRRDAAGARIAASKMSPPTGSRMMSAPRPSVTA
jgi:hypothetical protein